jgi:hypothetical protein
MEIYGLWVFQHHSTNRVLTVMSRAGVTNLRAHMTDVPSLEIRGGARRFTQYVEQGNGALDRLICTYQIKVLDLERWSAMKIEFGEDCRR